MSVGERWLDRAVLGLSAVLAVVLLGPAMGPGYALVGDMVFVPDQDLQPWMAGLGGSLPRAVPQDVVVALVTGLVPGWVWQSVALLAALILLGTGVGRLLRSAGRRASLVAAVVAVWSPFVGERLLLGHWSLLLAVGALPWALHHARSARDGVPGAPARWILLVALASLTVTGGILVLMVSGPVLLWRGGSGTRVRLMSAVAGVLLQLPWLVPALLHTGGAIPGGADVFALRPEGALGALATALGTGGVWNAAAVPGSRSTWLAPLLTAVLLALALLGRRAVTSALGRPVAITLLVASVLGLAVAVGGAWWVGGLSWVVAHVPGGGLLRDGQKWLAPWLILLSCAAGCGATRVAATAARRGRERALGTVLLVGALVLPLACLPDLAWGSWGRLSGVRYPADWDRVRSVLASDPRPGDVVSLPWSAYRRFPWNEGRTVLDPAPRYMPRTVVVSGDLLVAHEGAVVVVPGDDPRATRVGAALTAGGDLTSALRAEGIGFALVEHVVGDPAPALPGARIVVRGSDLDLYRLGEPAELPPARGRLAVLVANLLAVAAVGAAALQLVRTRARRRRG